MQHPPIEKRCTADIVVGWFGGLLAAVAISATDIILAAESAMPDLTKRKKKRRELRRAQLIVRQDLFKALPTDLLSTKSRMYLRSYVLLLVGIYSVLLWIPPVCSFFQSYRG